MSKLTSDEWLAKELHERLRQVSSPASAYFGAGYAAMIEGETERALLAFRKALDLDPGNALYHQMQGITLADSNDNAGAVEEFRKAIALDCRGMNINIPEENPYFHLGWCLEDLRHLEAAAISYKESIEHVPVHDESYLRLGKLYHDQGNFDQACEVYKAAVAFYRDFNPDLLDRTIFKNMNFNLQRAARGGPYQEYEPSEEERLRDVKLIRLAGKKKLNWEGNRASVRIQVQQAVSQGARPIIHSHPGGGDAQRTEPISQKVLTSSSKGNGEVGRSRATRRIAGHAHWRQYGGDLSQTCYGAGRTDRSDLSNPGQCGGLKHDGDNYGLVRLAGGYRSGVGSNTCASPGPTIHRPHQRRWPFE